MSIRRRYKYGSVLTGVARSRKHPSEDDIHGEGHHVVTMKDALARFMATFALDENHPPPMTSSCRVTRQPKRYTPSTRSHAAAGNDDNYVDEPWKGSDDDVKPYPLRQRVKVNYAIPPPLEETKPVPNIRLARSKRRPGWSASGAELSRCMGMPVGDS
ncbi:hypothetical protein PAXRUDRAFT_554662 [Paxillus rubicundulus Ve08.2h10]|uniref:Uncharacterized protein n=1 Tax=Paxillus rubicundulus Ve08.2h10 TaxID=930991 RepID=A0A0D0E5J9_9AGAM|nr:hypothetical protein PAXRUDRAFT_554662 [Paxillus rubicundulus Ve08.2h10]